MGVQELDAAEAIARTPNSSENSAIITDGDELAEAIERSAAVERSSTAFARRTNLFLAAVLAFIDAAAMGATSRMSGGVDTLHDSCLAAAIIVMLNASAGLYRLRTTLSVLQALPPLLIRAVMACGFTAAILPLGSEEPAAGITGVQAIGMILAGYAVTAVLIRLVIYHIARRLRKYRPRAVLVINSGAATLNAVNLLLRHPEYGLRPAATIVVSDSQPGEELPLTNLGDLRDLQWIIQHYWLEAVMLAPSDLPAALSQTVMSVCAEASCDLLLIPPQDCLFTGYTKATEYLDGVPYVLFQGGQGCSRRPLEKRALDIVLACAALTVVAPLLAVCMAAVRMEGGPGVFFRQTRVGLRGRLFVLLKLRTFTPTTDEEANTRWSIAEDDRIGRVGRFLRRTSLDELPQLWNVIRGEMSLVGPRPERPHFVQHFSQTVPGYTLRHRMPPGMTGWAQVHGLRGDTSIVDRVRFDNHYISAWSVGLDIRILMLTIRAILPRTNR